MQCPFIHKNHDCQAIDLYHQNMICYPNPCTTDCNMIRIKQLEEKMKFSSNMHFVINKEELMKMLMNDPLQQNDKIKIEQNTAGDSRVAKGVPTIEEFDHANRSHQDDVKHLAGRFMNMLNNSVSKHDWTKTTEPYRSMFYADLCAAINGKADFMQGEWANKHYNELERHHLHHHVPDDVNLFDVIEMICDCVAAGMARDAENFYTPEIDPDILMKAFNNTVNLMKDQVVVVDKHGVEVDTKERPMRPESGPSFHGESWNKCPRCGKSFEYWDTVHECGFTHVRDRIYRHDECGQLIDMT